MTPIYEAIREAMAELALLGVLPESFNYSFVVNSLLCALLIGPLLGALGTMVVIKRLAFFSEAVGHAALTGISIGIIVGEPYTNPYASVFAFCLLFALLMNFVKHRTQMSSDTLIGVFLSASLGVGACLLVFVVSKVNIHMLDSVLFGSILTVNDTDMNVLLAITILCLIIGALFFNRFLLASLNPSLAEARGVPVRALDYLFIIMIAVVTVASLKIVGAVLVEALLLIPAASARNVSRSLKGYVGFSVLFATLSCLVGILVPVEFDIPVPSGGAIIVCAAFLFFLTTGFRIFRVVQ